VLSAAFLLSNVPAGRAWTGRQALRLGLVDGLGDMRDIMQHQFGDKARFLLCSEAPQPGIRDLFGLGTLLRGGGGAGGGGGGEPAAGNGGSGGVPGVMDRLAAVAAGGQADEMFYAAARSTMEAAMDEAEQRALWDRFRMQ
jgi:ClpP class serine protease